MKANGRIESITKPLRGNGYLVTLRLDALPQGLENKDLDVEIKEFRPHRSKDANALLWACIGDIAKAITSDPWSVYLRMLRRYGKFTQIVVTPGAVEAVKKQWREAEVIGDYEVNGKKAVCMLCYYGSSTYDSKEMSALLDGVLSEMDEMHLQKPASSTLQRAIDEWEKRNGT